MLSSPQSSKVSLIHSNIKFAKMLLNFCFIGTGLEFQEIFTQLSFQLLLVISLKQLRHDEWLFKKVMASHNGRKKEIIHPKTH